MKVDTFMGKHPASEKACVIRDLEAGFVVEQKNTHKAYLISDSDERFVLNLPASVAPVAPTYLLPHSMR